MLAKAVLLTSLFQCWAIPPTVTLRNGVKMPMIAAGVFEYNRSTAYVAVTNALKVGFTHIDTALDYHNQDAVGRAIRDSGVSRDQIFVETKVPGCGNPLENTTRNPFTCFKDTQKNLESNLQQLGLDHVDLVIIHFPPIPSFITRSCNAWSGGCAMVKQQWKAMEEFYKAGKAKAIGVSNYCPSCFECLNGTEVFPMVNQFMYHVKMGVDPSGYVTYDMSHGVVTQAYSALGNNFFGADPDILHGNVTTPVAKKHGVSTAQVALKWIVQKNIPAVTKSANPTHLKEDLDLWSWDFDIDDIAALDSMKGKGGYAAPSYACDSLLV